MTAPGDSNQVGSIAAYLNFHREDWIRGVAETKRDAGELGRLRPNIRMDTNAGETIAQLKAVQAAERSTAHEGGGLIGVLASIAPAAIPIGAVAGGVFLGLIPTLAAAALGVAGITSAFKSGQLEGTAYGQDIKTLQGWLGELKTTAASGLLDGLHTAVRQSRGDISDFNQDLAVSSHQLGGILAGGINALLGLLHQLAPLFNTIGDALNHGADAAGNWAHNSDGVAKFVAYVQAELPHVIDFLQSVAVMFGHVASAAAPFGGVVLTNITLLVRALDSIPVGVLRAAIPVAVSLYVALKAYALIGTIIRGVNVALASLEAAAARSAAANAASAAQQQAAALRIQAAVSAEAAEVAYAKAAEARAAAEAATAISVSSGEVESLFASESSAAGLAAASISESMGLIESMFASEAESAALSADAVATALEAEAVAAIEAAATIGAAAEEAAATSLAAGETAAVGWGAMLGPLAAVGIGIGLLTTSFGDNEIAATTDAAAIESYTQALINSKGAIDDQVRGKVALALADSGALAAAQRLGISTVDLTDAVIGNGAAHSRVAAILQSYTGTAEDAASVSGRQRVAAFQVNQALHDQSGEFGTAVAQAKLYRSAMRDNANQVHIVADAVRDQAHQLGLNIPAYQTATQAAKKNTEQTRAQTTAFQLENDAASLVNQALAIMSGQNLNVAQAQTSFQQSTLAAVQALKKSKDEIKGNGAAALDAQSAIQGAVQQARSVATAVAQQTHSNKEAAQSYRDSKQALLDQLEAHNRLTPAIRAYVGRLFDVKNVSDYLNAHPTKFDVDTLPAIQAAADVTRRFSALAKLDPTIDVYADTKRALTNIEQFVKTPWETFVRVTTVGGSGPVSSGRQLLDPGQPHAAGGPITGPGPEGVDSVRLYGAPGEWVITDEAVDKITAKYGPGAMAAINRGVLPTAAPASAVRSTPQAAASAPPSPGQADVAAAIHGARFVLDAGSVGALTGHIDTRAAMVADGRADYRDSRLDLYR